MQQQFELYPHDRNAAILFLIIFGPMMGIALVMAFWLDSMALKCLFVPLCILLVWLTSRILDRAGTKLVLHDHKVSIVNNRKVILPVTDLHEFKVVYFLDLTWRYTGKYRIGDPIGKEVWESLRYCVFAREEIGEEAVNVLSHRLRKKRINGAIPEGLAFDQAGKYFPLMKTYISENSRVIEKKITLKPGAF